MKKILTALALIVLTALPALAAKKEMTVGDYCDAIRNGNDLAGLPYIQKFVEKKKLGEDMDQFGRCLSYKAWTIASGTTITQALDICNGERVNNRELFDSYDFVDDFYKNVNFLNDTFIPLVNKIKSRHPDMEVVEGKYSYDKGTPIKFDADFNRIGEPPFMLVTMKYKAGGKEHTIVTHVDVSDLTIKTIEEN